jgi:hypothetical protein
MKADLSKISIEADRVYLDSRKTKAGVSAKQIGFLVDGRIVLTETRRRKPKTEKP